MIITGANGVGKSHLAARLALVRPDVPVVSFDAIKLRTNWQQRPRQDIEQALTAEMQREKWILEGGPSILPCSVEKADALIWLDPPESLRALRLAIRPWKFIGKNRPELPGGNVDWPLQQYAFALRSLRKGKKLRRYIADVFDRAEHLRKWRCRNETDITQVVEQWRVGHVQSVST